MLCAGMCRGGELQPKVEAQRYGDVTMPMRFKDPEEAIGLRTHSESTGGETQYIRLGLSWINNSVIGANYLIFNYVGEIKREKRKKGKKEKKGKKVAGADFQCSISSGRGNKIHRKGSYRVVRLLNVGHDSGFFLPGLSMH